MYRLPIASNMRLTTALLASVLLMWDLGSWVMTLEIEAGSFSKKRVTLVLKFVISRISVWNNKINKLYLKVTKSISYFIEI